MVSFRLQVEEIETKLDTYKEGILKFGLTITTDGWDDNSGRHLHNFMVVTSNGPYFHSSVNTSDVETINAKYVADGIIKVIKEVGPKYVVSVITDGASVMRSAWELVKVRVNACVHSLMHEYVCAAPSRRRAGMHTREQTSSSCQ